MPTPVIILFLSIGFVAWALSSLLESATGALLLLLYPVFYFLIKQRLQIDFDAKMCRLGIDYFGYTKGTWVPLPHIEYVSVFNQKYSHTRFEDGGDLSWEENYSKLEVKLVINKKETITAWIGDDRVEALRAALYLAKHLNVKVLDATRRPFEWLE